MKPEAGTVAVIVLITGHINKDRKFKPKEVRAYCARSQSELVWNMLSNLVNIGI